MKKYLLTLPLFHVLTSVRLKYIKTYCLTIVFIGLYAVQISKIYSVSVQKVFFHQFHLHESSFFKWSVIQTIPTMYSFSNQIWWSRTPIDENNLFSEMDEGVNQYHVYINHFPLHFVTYNHYRDLFFKSFKENYLVVESQFRGNQMRSFYTLNRDGGVVTIAVENYKFERVNDSK